MPGSVVKRINSLLVAASIAALLSVAWSGLHYTPAYAQASSTVVVAICGAGATISVTEPASDSVVTEPAIVFKGSVTQATQIEVEVDGAFDSVVSLGATQQTYEAPVQLSVGTHTVKLTAVDSCDGVNASTSSVITFTPPPGTSSSGASTNTGVNTGSSAGTGGVTIHSGEGADVRTAEPHNVVLQPLFDAFDGLSKWLNIAPVDSSYETTGAKLSLLRAIIIAVGAGLLIMGAPTSFVSRVALLFWFDRFGKKRRRVVKYGIRIIGAVLLLGGLFL